MRELCRLMAIWTFVVIACALVIIGCSPRRPAGKIIGSRSAEGWTGPAFYLLVETEDGRQREISVTREEYHKLRTGEDFVGD